MAEAKLDIALYFMVHGCDGFTLRVVAKLNTNTVLKYLHEASKAERKRHARLARSQLAGSSTMCLVREELGLAPRAPQASAIPALVCFPHVHLSSAPHVAVSPPLGTD